MGKNNGQLIAKSGRNQIVTQIFAKKNFFIESLDGQETIISKRKSFFGVDHDFEKLGLNSPGLQTPEIKIRFYKVAKSTILHEAFEYISVDFEKLVLSQAQVVRFCQKYYDIFNSKVFCLIEQYGRYYPVEICKSMDGLGIYISFFNKKLYGTDCCQIISPLF